MRREQRLIRRLLEYAECTATGAALPVPEYDDYTAVVVHYHVGLCAQAGYLEVADVTNGADVGTRYSILNLTWKGHDKLDALRGIPVDRR